MPVALGKVDGAFVIADRKEIYWCNTRLLRQKKETSKGVSRVFKLWSFSYL